MLEQLALGTNAYLDLELVNVVAADSSGFGNSGFGNTIVIPGNNGDCLIAASGGAGNADQDADRRQPLANCANNGLTFGSAVANGCGATSLLDLAIADIRITANQGANLRIGNVSGGLDRLRVEVERTRPQRQRGGDRHRPRERLLREPRNDRPRRARPRRRRARLDRRQLPRGRQIRRRADRLRGQRPRQLVGEPTGPGPGRVLSVNGSLDSGQPLAASPACGPGR